MNFPRSPLARPYFAPAHTVGHATQAAERGTSLPWSGFMVRAQCEYAVHDHLLALSRTRELLAATDIFAAGVKPNFAVTLTMSFSGCGPDIGGAEARAGHGALEEGQDLGRSRPAGLAGMYHAGRGCGRRTRRPLSGGTRDRRLPWPAGRCGPRCQTKTRRPWRATA